ncbi:MAG TPA: ABC transporter substrate-binding protein [Candidatus Acidoferrales bacterium]|nr:ABC transporter substrate-binding protein [Candidatus Acidoferrales bacterium]
MSRLLVLLLFATLVAAVPLGTAAAEPVPLKVGIVFSFSGGDNVELGKEFDAAISAYQKEHGDVVAGRKIVLLKRDDGGIAPEAARRLTQELIVQDKVELIVGTSYTPNALAMEQVSTAAKVPFFIVNAATSGIMSKAPYTARFGFTQAQITDAFGRWAAKSVGNTAYLLFQDYGPGIDAGTTFAKAFGAAGGTILGESRIPVNNTDFSAYVQRAKDAKPKVLYVFLNATGGGIQFLKAIKTSGIEQNGTKVLVNGALVNEALLPAEGDSAIGLYSTSDYTAMHNSALNRKFVKDFKAAYGANQNPTFIAVAAYDAMNAVYRVIDAQHGKLDPDKTMDIVKGMKFESPRGPIAIDPATRDIILNAYFMKTERRGGILGNYEFETTSAVKDPSE